MYLYYLMSHNHRRKATNNQNNNKTVEQRKHAGFIYVSDSIRVTLLLHLFSHAFEKVPRSGYHLLKK